MHAWQAPSRSAHQVIGTRQGVHLSWWREHIAEPDLTTRDPLIISFLTMMYMTFNHEHTALRWQPWSTDFVQQNRVSGRRSDRVLKPGLWVPKVAQPCRVSFFQAVKLAASSATNSWSLRDTHVELSTAVILDTRTFRAYCFKLSTRGCHAQPP